MKRILRLFKRRKKFEILGCHQCPANNVCDPMQFFASCETRKNIEKLVNERRK